MDEVEGRKEKEKRTPSATMEREVKKGIWTRWKDGKGKADAVRNKGERSERGYVDEVEGWKRKRGYVDEVEGRKWKKGRRPQQGREK